MSPRTHKIYIWTLSAIVIACTLFLTIYGASYYGTSMEERFYHPAHKVLKPSGMYGHGLGILGTLLILIGVFGYMARKRFKSWSRIGVLKYWLEFHIFLCILGPIFILFHTAFKFGGIVSISFWSMVIVVASGVVGRFIYKQIPRTIQGRALGLNEIKEMKDSVQNELSNWFLKEGVINPLPSLAFADNEDTSVNSISNYFKKYIAEYRQISHMRSALRNTGLPGEKNQMIIKLVKHEFGLNRRIKSLKLMQKLFRYWHVAHLPFAIIMLIIMVIHVVVTLMFGYKWIF